MCFNVKMSKWASPPFLQEKFTFITHGLSTCAEVAGKLVINQPNFAVFKCFTCHEGPDDFKNCASVDNFKFIYKTF